jgi:hypothetical protein
MSNRLFLQGILTLLMAVFCIGCKSSPKEAKSGPSGTPTPATQPSAKVQVAPVQEGNPVVQGKGSTPASSPLDTMVPVKTYKVEPPASFVGDQIPEGQAVEFDLAGNAGQFLRVNVGEVYAVKIQPPGGGQILRPGGDSAGNWYYALPRTGVYKVLYSPPDHSEIKFSFLAANDPLADPGLTREQFSIDFGEVTKDPLAIVPYALHEDEDYPDSWPTHWAVESQAFEFRIMTVAGYKKLFGEYQALDALAAVLHTGGKAGQLDKLPYAVFQGGALNMSARRELFSGDGWHGLRWIGAFGQDIACTQDLAYVFEGTSDDGKYFVLVRAKIENPEAESRFGSECAAAIKESRDPDLDQIFERDMAAAADSFKPHLNKLDAVIRTLKFQH